MLSPTLNEPKSSDLFQQDSSSPKVTRLNESKELGQIQDEEIWLPRKFWNRPEFNSIGADLSVNPETKELLGLNEAEYSEMEKVVEAFRAAIEQSENEVMVDRSTESSAVIVIPAWSSNSNALSDSFKADLGSVIGSQKAEYLMEKETVFSFVSKAGTRTRCCPNCPTYSPANANE